MPINIIRVEEAQRSRPSHAHGVEKIICPNFDIFQESKNSHIFYRSSNKWFFFKNRQRQLKFPLLFSLYYYITCFSNPSIRPVKIRIQSIRIVRLHYFFTLERTTKYDGKVWPTCFVDATSIRATIRSSFSLKTFHRSAYLSSVLLHCLQCDRLV